MVLFIIGSNVDGYAGIEGSTIAEYAFDSNGDLVAVRKQNLEIRFLSN